MSSVQMEWIESVSGFEKMVTMVVVYIWRWGVVVVVRICVGGGFVGYLVTVESMRRGGKFFVALSSMGPNE